LQEYACLSIPNAHQFSISPSLATLPTPISPSRLLLHTAALEKKQDPAFLPCPGMTRAALTPSLLAALLQSDAPILRAESSLRFCLCSGEALSWALAKELSARAPSCTVIHLYGSTEVSGDATWTTLTPMKEREEDEDKATTPTSDLVPLGEALPGTRLWVVEDGMAKKAQVGEADVGAVDMEGELWVAGPGVALGYYGAEENDLDAKFGRAEGEEKASLPLFKTGDWVHYVSESRKDGSEKHQQYTLTFRGRRDSLAKVRGVRVGLEEAERRTAAALGLEATGGCVGMMVVPNPNKSVREDAVLLLALTWEVATRFPHAAQLRERLREGGLPAEMIPSQIVVGVEGQPLPLTSSGKMDRQQLVGWGKPLESLGLSESTELPAREEDGKEQWLEDLFAKLVGRHHSEGQRGLGFFDRGGHSLLAMQALSEIEARFGTAGAVLTVEDLARTVPEIARLLSRAQQPAKLKKRTRSEVGEDGDKLQGLRLTECWRFAFEKCVDAPPCLVWVGPTEGWWVLIGAHDHSFAALDLMTGKEQWRIRVEGRIEGGAVVQGPLVFVPSHDSQLYAYFILTGQFAWSCCTGGEIKGAPSTFCLAGLTDTEKTSLIAFGSYDGHLYIVEASSGELWAPPSPLGGSPFASPLLLPAAAAEAAAAARLVTVTNRGRVAQWQVQRLGDGRGAVTLHWSQEVGCAVFTTPILSSASSLLVLGGTDGSAVALRPAQGGAVVWRTPLDGANGVGAAPIFASPCLLPAGKDNEDDDEEEGVLVACQSSLHCLSLKSGKRKWLVDTSTREGEVITGKPAVLKDSRFVLVSTSHGRLLVLAVQKESTEVIATLSLGAGQRLSSPVVVLASERVVGGKKSWRTVVGSRDDGVYMVEIEENLMKGEKTEHL